MTTTAPTPWARSTIENSTEPYMIRDANGYAVADCRHYHSHHRADLNLDLIVRAVNCHADLLAALEAVVDRYAPTWSPANNAVDAMWRDARAAIAKARGLETQKQEA